MDFPPGASNRLGRKNHPPGVDIAALATVLPHVTARLRSLFALLLLALWLPATQHCGLEAAGWLDVNADCHAQADCRDGHDKAACDADNCQSVESGAYKSQPHLLKVPAPVVLACRCCLHVISPETIVVPLVSPARTNPPPELAPSWRFIARAAPAPRAPTLVS